MKSWLEISGSRLAENFRAVQSVAGAGVEVLAVVKANAYGHGATLCSPVLVEAGARWLGVSDAAEGQAIREAFPHSGTRLLVMCAMELSDAPQMVAHGLSPVIWTPEQVAAMERAARSAGHRVNVHLEIETGMARQGAAPGAELARVLDRLAGSRWVCCEGIMTHLASAETAGAALTAAQRERFTAALAQTSAAGVKPEYIHIGNSSAVDEGGTMGWIRETAEAMNARAMVRAGYALYGLCLPLVSSAGGEVHAPALKPRVSPVLCWKTRIVGLRDVAAGATVGYGATFVADCAMRLALLPVGYADGFRRAASSGLGSGWVIVAGQRAPVIGRVSMNLTVVDVTAIKQVYEGMDVTLLGEGVSAEDHARLSGTIAYEILCGVRGQMVRC